MKDPTGNILVCEGSRRPQTSSLMAEKPVNTGFDWEGKKSCSCFFFPVSTVLGKKVSSPVLKVVGDTPVICECA